MSPTLTPSGMTVAGVLGRAAGTRGQDFALLGLLLGGVGDDQAAGGGLLGLVGPHDDAVFEGLELHALASVGVLAVSLGDC